VLVDPEVLRAFAGKVSDASVSIRAADAGQVASAAADPVPGSTTQWAMRLVGEHITSSSNGIADHVTKMGAAVRGAGDSFKVEDEALAGAFDRLF
jgi:hypothetical protein